jgi:hypothetical protein
VEANMTTKQLLIPVIPFAIWFALTVILVATTLLAPMWISIG